MDIRTQLHKLVDDLDDATVKLELHADIDDGSLRAALAYMRMLRSLFDQLARSDKLHALNAALMSTASFVSAAALPA
jgi:hypothetical protein